MSQNTGSFPSEAGTGDGSSQGKADVAKQEAAELKDTAQEQVGNVAAIAKDEASTVVHETKAQLKDVYSQTRHELTEQAAAQQRRVADGLRSVGEQFGSMAQRSDTPGVAADLVQQASTRLAGVSTWLADRDPGSLLQEVKTYARRKPGIFIAGALVAGIAAGRLTRALAEGHAEENAASGSTGSGTPSTVAAPPAPPAPPVPPASATPAYAPGVPEAASAPIGGAQTPLYDRTVQGGGATEEIYDGR
jgi:gas vesicle protein